MGKKVNPKIIRTGVIRTWPSVWFSRGQDYIKNVQQDVNIRKFLLHHLREAGVNEVKIERDSKKIRIAIHTAKPGLIIGRGGAGIEELKKKIHRRFLKNFPPNEIDISIKEVDRPNLSAQVVLQSMIVDLEKRVPFKKVMKQAASRVEKAGALGVKIIVKGRLNGSEIARAEKFVNGKVPLQTLRSDIDYARGWAHTSYGSIGIKIWIYKGDIFGDSEEDTGEVVNKKHS